MLAFQKVGFCQSPKKWFPSFSDTKIGEHLFWKTLHTPSGFIASGSHVDNI